MHACKYKPALYAACFFLITIVHSSPLVAQEQLHQLIHSASKVGDGRMRFLFWDVFDATLYAPDGIWRENKSFALQLTYLREIDGRKIVDQSIEEMRNQGFRDEIKLATWHSQLRNLFPNVVKGTTLTGYFIDTGETVFFLNNEEIGSINDPQFRRAFSGIWLSEKTSAPDLRQALLGQP